MFEFINFCSEAGELVGDDEDEDELEDDIDEEDLEDIEETPEKNNVSFNPSVKYFLMLSRCKICLSE